jgi:hypothetical protein
MNRLRDHSPIANAAQREAGAGRVRGAPLLLLRAEGLGLLAAAAVGYGALGASWWLFAALLLLPDLAMLGYLAGPRIGALCYNAAHTTLGPAALGLVAWVTGAPLAGAVALVWAAHVGLDRAAGYGLKYARAFRATHLSG